MLALLGLTSLFGPGPCLAEQSPRLRGEGVLEEVVVTARRREEAYFDVPMAITSIDGEILQRLQYRDIRDFLGLSSGVLIHEGGDTLSSQITIRGVVTPGFLVQPGNAVYVDEIYASGLRTILPGYYDIESVQVLKGPQAALYGRNTTGGAVVITTAKPTDERLVRLDLSYAQLDTLDTNATVNLPLSDSLRMRATAWYSDSEGGYYQSELSRANADATRQGGGRLSLAVSPSETIALTLTGEYAEDSSGDIPGVVAGAPLGPAELGVESRRNVLRDDLVTMDFDSARVSGKLEAELGPGSVVAVAGWREVNVRLPGTDWDGTAHSASAEPPPRPFAPTVLDVDDRDSLRELELRFLSRDAGAALRFLLGVNYLEEALRFSDTEVPVRELARALEAIGQYGTFELRGKQDTRAWASFGELIWAARETIEVTADLRYTRERQDIDSVQDQSGYYALTRAYLELHTDTVFENWSPGITLSWKPAGTLNLFARYVRGFRAGGYNALASSEALLTYGAEESENYELGGKALLFGQRLEVGASLFYLYIDDALLPQLDLGVAGNPLWPLQNIGTAKTRGLELDLSAAPVAGLTVAAALGAYHYGYSGGPQGYEQRAFAPDFTAALSANYHWPLSVQLTGIASLGYRYRGKALSPAGDEYDVDTYNLLDAQLGIRWRAVEVAGFVRNALDDHYKLSDWGASFFQRSFFPQDGSYTGSTHSTVRDPGSIYGVRLSLTF